MDSSRPVSGEQRPGSDVEPPSRHRSWVLFGAVAIVLAVIGLTNQRELGQLGDLWWNHGSYGHGLLVLPVSLFLVWSNRARLTVFAPTPLIWPLALVFVFTAVWMAGDVADIMIVKQLCVVLLFLSIVLAVLGKNFFYCLAFPIAYVLTAFPVWEVFVPVLRDVTAIASASILRALSVPVYLEGNTIHIPRGTFEIADVCAGLRFFMAGLALAGLYAYLNLRSWRMAAVFTIAAVAWVIIFNWIRVAMVVLIGHLAGMGHPLVGDHYFVGWVLFVVAMIPLMLLGSKLQKVELTPATGVSPQPNVNSLASTRELKGLAVAALGGLIILGGPAFISFAEPSSISSEARTIVLPDSISDWKKFEFDAQLGSNFVGADDQVTASYAKSGQHVTVYVAFYTHQRQGAELINSENVIFEKERWRTVERRVARLQINSAETLTAVEVALTGKKVDTYKLVRYWYIVGGRSTHSGVGAKLFQVLGGLVDRYDSMAVVVSTDSGQAGTTGPAAEILDEFGRWILPALDTQLD